MTHWWCKFLHFYAFPTYKNKKYHYTYFISHYLCVCCMNVSNDMAFYFILCTKLSKPNKNVKILYKWFKIELYWPGCVTFGGVNTLRWCASLSIQNHHIANSRCDWMFRGLHSSNIYVAYIILDELFVHTSQCGISPRFLYPVP